MEQDEKRVLIAFEAKPELKKWLERKSAERIVEGRPHGDRSVGAVIRDILLRAAREELEAVPA